MPGGHAGHKGTHAAHNGFKKQKEVGSGSGQVDEEKGKSWAAKLNDKERSAIKSYGEGEYIRINQSLRSGGTESEVADIDRALASSPTVNDEIVFRAGIDPGAGKTFRDKGFVSTIRVEKLLSNTPHPAIWEIKVPKGTNAAYIEYAKGTAGTRMDEKEMLLARGLKYRILKREKVGNKIRINAEVVN